MLSPSQLNPSLHAAAQHLLTELRRLQPGLATEAQTLVVLLDAVTVQTGNLLVQQAAPAEVVTCWTDDDVLVALQGGGLTHAVSVRALTRTLIYTSPDGQHLHPASRDHLQG